MLGEIDLLDMRVWQETVPLVLVCCFLLFLYHVLSSTPSMFVKRHGRYHAITGLLYLLWISWGFFALLVPKLISMSIPAFVYDVVLGIIGTVLTLYAANEFQHKNVKNFASGTLDEHATVTYGEMIEHSFYQALNLVQIIFLHLFSFYPGMPVYFRLLALFFVTSPWLLRDRFPVNKFSDNYKEIDEKSTTLIRLLYRIKKYQYVFYKHFILHGLNITVAVNDISIANNRGFRLFWLLLNLSYVMEFFLQTLVKKNYMSQSTMLSLQKILMSAASLSSTSVLRVINFPAALASLILNFTNRKQDLFNTLLVGVGFVLISNLFSPAQ
jgi:hypothetical protein